MARGIENQWSGCSFKYNPSCLSRKSNTLRKHSNVHDEGVDKVASAHINFDPHELA
jgi:hypothetical protein